jgi:hypothetical protein
MAVYRGTYESDLGRDFWAVGLSTRFISADSRDALPDESNVLPFSFKAWVQAAPGVCPLKLSPRTARLKLSNFLFFEFPIPWRGGSPRFLALLVEMSLRTDIQDWEILPEKIPPGLCHLLVK